MLSGKDSLIFGLHDGTVAMFKGLAVTVRTVEKPEVVLSRQDIIELVDVCNFSSFFSLQITPFSLTTFIKIM